MAAGGVTGVKQIMWVPLQGNRGREKDDARLEGALQLRHHRVEVAFEGQLLCAQRSYIHVSLCTTRVAFGYVPFVLASYSSCQHATPGMCRGRNVMSRPHDIEGTPDIDHQLAPRQAVSAPVGAC